MDASGSHISIVTHTSFGAGVNAPQIQTLHEHHFQANQLGSVSKLLESV